MGRESTETSEKAEWLQGHKQLATRLTPLEKDRWATKMHEELNKVWGEMEKDAMYADNKRYQENRKLAQHLKVMRQELMGVQTMVALVKNGIDSGKTLQDSLENLESNILNFKKKMRQDLEDLWTDEKLVQKELDMFIKRMEGWRDEHNEEEKYQHHHDSYKDKGTPRTQHHKGNDDIEHAVERINEKIAREGGLTGGWHPTEHDLFLSAWSKCHGAQLLVDGTEIDEGIFREILERCSVLIRDRSPESIAEHVHWYIDYTKLIAEKKELIHAWKDAKQKEREEALKHEAEMQEEQKSASKNPEKEKLMRLERLKKKKMVEAWKEQKKTEQAKAEKKKAKMEEEEREKEERKRIRMIQAKQQVQMYKLEKEQERERKLKVEKIMEQSEKSPRPTPRIDLEERQKEMIAQAKQKREQIEKASLERKQQERLEKQKQILSNIEYSATAPKPQYRHAYRDPDRLIKSTQASKVREYSEKELAEKEEERIHKGAHERPMAGMARDLLWAGRAVPEWRRNVAGLM